MIRSAVPVPVALGLLLLAGALAPPAQADLSARKGLFAGGGVRGSVSAGWVSTAGDDYLQVGGGLGYNLRDGVTVGLDYGAWLVGEPTVQKLTPWASYTFWQVPRIKPYAGVFLRQNWVDGRDDFRDLGARAGVFLPRGRAQLGVGVVYEYRLDDGFVERDRFYPEVHLAFGF